MRRIGVDVGLPEGQIGNSEVGHLNIGSGRVVMPRTRPAHTILGARPSFVGDKQLISCEFAPNM